MAERNRYSNCESEYHPKSSKSPKNRRAQQAVASNTRSQSFYFDRDGDRKGKSTWKVINPYDEHTPNYDEIKEIDKRAGHVFGGGKRLKGGLVFTPTVFRRDRDQTIIGRAHTPTEAEKIVKGYLRARLGRREISHEQYVVALRSNPRGKKYSNPRD